MKFEFKEKDARLGLFVFGFGKVVFAHTCLEYMDGKELINSIIKPLLGGVNPTRAYWESDVDKDEFESTYEAWEDAELVATDVGINAYEGSLLTEILLGTEDVHEALNMTWERLFDVTKKTVVLWKTYNSYSFRFNWQMEEIQDDWNGVSSEPYLVEIPKGFHVGENVVGQKMFFKDGKKMGYDLSIYSTRKENSAPVLIGSDGLTGMRVLGKIEQW